MSYEAEPASNAEGNECLVKKTISGWGWFLQEYKMEKRPFIFLLNRPSQAGDDLLSSSGVWNGKKIFSLSVTVKQTISGWGWFLQAGRCSYWPTSGVSTTTIPVVKLFPSAGLLYTLLCTTGMNYLVQSCPGHAAGHRRWPCGSAAPRCTLHVSRCTDTAQTLSMGVAAAKTCMLAILPQQFTLLKSLLSLVSQDMLQKIGEGGSEEGVTHDILLHLSWTCGKGTGTGSDTTEEKGSY